MIQLDTLQFFQNLSKNNTKEWFDANRKDYGVARQNFIDFANVLIEGIAKFDEGVAASNLEAKKTMMRINRDIRFSKDKTPYNTHFFSSISKGGKSSYNAGYFVSISPNNSFYGGGLYKPDSATINKVRQEIDYNPEEWLQIVESPDLKSRFGEVQSSDQLIRPPKGYSKDNPLLSWLKRKDYYMQNFRTDEQIIHPDNANQIIKDLEVVNPLISFLNKAIDG